MKLFGSQRTQLLFLKAELKRNRDGDRRAVLVWKIKLNGQNVRSTPTFIKESYAACRSAQTEASIDGAIEVQNIEVFSMPEHKRSAVRLPAVVFDHLVIRRSKENDIYLTMRTSVGLGDGETPLARWVTDSYGTEIWAEFEDAQGKLLDSDDDGDVEEVDSEEVEAGSEDAEESTPE